MASYAIAPLPENEAARLKAVQALNLLDTSPEERFDAIVRLAARFFKVPISYVSLVDKERQWFKSRFGLSDAETPRDVAFCAFTILGDKPFVVPDAARDPRFAKNPLVTGNPHIGAYCGVPLNDINNQKVGTLCLADHQAHEFSKYDTEVLEDLARLVERELHLGDMIRQRDEQLRTQALLIESQQELEKEKELAETLLLSLMPAEIAKELRSFGTVEPRYYHDVSVMFTDFVGFTTQTENLAAEDLVTLLNGYFIALDKVVGDFGMEKLKTIGHRYMCVGGMPVRSPSHPVDAILAAVQMREVIREFNRSSDEIQLEVRIGIHTGPVVAGVVGMLRFAFDIWGETVNSSARIESAGAPDSINISDCTWSRVKDFFECEHLGKVVAQKNKEHDMYVVKGILPGLEGSLESGVPDLFQRRYRTYFNKELTCFPVTPGTN